jgi:GDPmannose 4,6-dehydratase
MKRAFITGITGQDGSYLTELLHSKDYELAGLVRPQSKGELNEAQYLSNKVKLYYGSIENHEDITLSILDFMPDEIYNLASQSSPAESWVKNSETLLINGLGAARLFEVARVICPNARIYHASSSEMFGNGMGRPQNESTPLNPLNPYAASKVYAHNMAHIYRECYGSFIANGILFNHESTRRPLNFVVQKIAFGAACAALKIQTSVQKNEIGKPLVENSKLALGNLEISRDWGHAKDFVRAMWLMLQHDKPDDFIVGTGVLHSLKDVCSLAYSHVGLDWTDYIVSKKELTRPIESAPVLADHSKASRVLDWNPTISFEQMIGEMVDEKLLYLAD